ncbi:MAG: hypothetical protein WD512_19665 [Candidatus Paceibacterota bacterium]
MEFEIDFNRESDDDTLKEIGAYLVPTDATKYPPFEVFMIKIDGFEELEKLLNRVESLKGIYYGAVVGFDPPTIYLDKEV